MVSQKQERNERIRREVLAEWDRWRPSHEKTMMGGMRFFTYLQKEKPELLDFSAPGDKWQTVHGWLLRAKLVKE